MDYNFYIIILLCVISLVILYYLFLYLSSNPYLVSSVYDLKTVKPSVPSNAIKDIKSIRYTYSVWIYVNNLNTNYGSSGNGSEATKNTLFSFENQQSGTHLINATSEEYFSLYFLRNKPQLNMHIKGYKSSADTSSITSKSEIIISKNFPLQKWTNIIVSVDTYFIDIYMDGNLVKSVAINSATQTPIAVPTSENLIINFGSGQDIKLSRLIRLPYQIDPGTAYGIFSQGNGVSNSSVTHFNVWYSAKDSTASGYGDQKNVITV